MLSYRRRLNLMERQLNQVSLGLTCGLDMIHPRRKWEISYLVITTCIVINHREPTGLDNDLCGTNYSLVESTAACLHGIYIFDKYSLKEDGRILLVRHLKKVKKQRAYYLIGLYCRLSP